MTIVVVPALFLFPFISLVLIFIGAVLLAVVFFFVQGARTLYIVETPFVFFLIVIFFWPPGIKGVPPRYDHIWPGRYPPHGKHRRGCGRQHNRMLCLPVYVASCCAWLMVMVTVMVVIMFVRVERTLGMIGWM